LDRVSVRTVNERLTGGGWLAVASLRLIPVLPFLPVNYCCGVSSLRTWPYLVGTVLGCVPERSPPCCSVTPWLASRPRQ
jgi:uncharacterized membrane protein YdjX (TVP38/TMEM64 family)